MLSYSIIVRQYAYISVRIYIYFTKFYSIRLTPLFSLWNVGGSTQVPVCAWNNAWKGILGLPLQVKLESCHMTYTMLVWLKTQQQQQQQKNNKKDVNAQWIIILINSNFTHFKF
jgi:hypothetical protein